MAAFLLIILGTMAGFLSGLIGIGGGILIVPALVYGFKYSQHMAQGTTLALMVPPIGLLAAWTYYKNGFVDWRAAAFICVGFLLGGWLGARFSISLPEEVLRKVFGTILLLVALRMILSR